MGLLFGAQVLTACCRHMLQACAAGKCQGTHNFPSAEDEMAAGRACSAAHAALPFCSGAVTMPELRGFVLSHQGNAPTWPPQCHVNKQTTQVPEHGPV